MKQQRTVAILSRHPLADDQRADLEARGYATFVQVQPPGRFLSAAHAWADMDMALGGRLPDLAVIVLPRSFVPAFVERAAFHRVPVVKSMFYRDAGWCGTWIEAYPATDSSGEIWFRLWGKAR